MYRLHRVHKVDGSSQKDENLKSKMDGYRTSPQSGRVIPRGWKFEVQNGRIQNKFTKWMDHPKRMKVWSSKWTSPQSGQIILRGWKFEVQNGWIQNKSTKWMDHPERMKVWSSKWTNPQSGRIIPRGWKFEVQNGRIQNKSTKWADYPKMMKIWSPKWTDTEQLHKVDESSQEDENLKSKMDGYRTIPQSGRVVPRGWKFEIQHGQTDAQVHKVDEESLGEENYKHIQKRKWTDKSTHPQTWRIIKNSSDQVDG